MSTYKRIIGEIARPSEAWLTCVVCGEKVTLIRPADAEPDEFGTLRGDCPGCHRAYKIERRGSATP